MLLDPSSARQRKLSQIAYVGADEIDVSRSAATEPPTPPPEPAQADERNRPPGGSSCP
jgi:hypothetical protein